MSTRYFNGNGEEEFVSAPQLLLRKEQETKRETQMNLLEGVHKSQWERIADLMSFGDEWTLMELQDTLRSSGAFASETGISARLRELAHGKKPGYTITKRTENGRTYWYKLTRTP